MDVALEGTHGVRSHPGDHVGGGRGRCRSQARRMSPSQRDDYILRQARAIAAILARIVGLRLEGNPQQASAGLEEAYTMLLGSQSGLIRRVDSATAAKLIGSSEKILSFAQL